MLRWSNPLSAAAPADSVIMPVSASSSHTPKPATSSASDMRAAARASRSSIIFSSWMSLMAPTMRTGRPSVESTRPRLRRQRYEPSGCRTRNSAWKPVRRSIASATLPVPRSSGWMRRTSSATDLLVATAGNPLRAAAPGDRSIMSLCRSRSHTPKPAASSASSMSCRSERRSAALRVAPRASVTHRRRSQPRAGEDGDATETHCEPGPHFTSNRHVAEAA